MKLITCFSCNEVVPVFSEQTPERFMFFHMHADDGMIEFMITRPEDFRAIDGWMGEQTRTHDTDFLEWVSRAKVGSYGYHRMGVIVRLSNTAGNDLEPIL